MKVKAIQHQSLMDIALTTAGDVRGVVAVAAENGLSITELLIPGQELSRAEVLEIDIVSFYQTTSNPATGYPLEVDYVEAPELPFVISQNLENKNTELTAIEGQNFMDLAIQAAGSVQAVIELAVKNGVGITDAPSIGIVLRKPPMRNADVAAFFQTTSNPATTTPLEVDYAAAAAFPFVLPQPLENKSTQLTGIEGQSFFDLAIQAAGGIQAVIELAVKNGISLTEAPALGTVLKKPGMVDIDTVAYFRSRGLRPASGIKDDCIYAECDYVESGYWE